MQELELPSIEQRVEKGIAWLEEQGAHDWAERIVAAVDAGRFDILNPCRCAVGSAFGEDFAWSRTLHMDAVAYGFCPLEDPDDDEPLEAEWERQARARVAWDTDRG